MLGKISIFTLIFAINGAKIPFHKPSPETRKMTILIEDKPEIKESLVFKLPEEIEPLKYTVPTVQGPGDKNNSYAWGNCTWWVARHKNIPEGWGNAREWLSRARAAGYRVGDKPVVGAVAWFPPGSSLGHVAYVKAINTDGSVTISEMNVKGLGRASERVIRAHKVKYIY
jgi:hypothetical protein